MKYQAQTDDYSKAKLYFTLIANQPSHNCRSQNALFEAERADPCYFAKNQFSWLLSACPGCLWFPSVRWSLTSLHCYARTAIASALSRDLGRAAGLEDRGRSAPGVAKCWLFTAGSGATPSANCVISDSAASTKGTLFNPKFYLIQSFYPICPKAIPHARLFHIISCFLFKFLPYIIVF